MLRRLFLSGLRTSVTTESLFPRCFSNVTKTAPHVLPFYRILARACRKLGQMDRSILLQPAINVHQYGSAKTLTNIESASNVDVLKTLSLETVENEWFRQLVPDFEQRADTIRDNNSYRSLWTNTHILIEALRFAFRNMPITVENSATKALAIQAFHFLAEQEMMQKTTSSCQFQSIHVTATSKCIGRSSDNKIRFAYRIRIENRSKDRTVQLLGRSWNIQDTTEEGEDVGLPIIVNAPQTGAVGHLPVLHPGEVFEYMSGSELGTRTGYMEGRFYLCWVPDDTPCAVVGQHIEAFESPDRFEVPVMRFALLGDSTGPTSE